MAQAGKRQLSRKEEQAALLVAPAVRATVRLGKAKPKLSKFQTHEIIIIRNNVNIAPRKQLCIVRYPKC